MNAIKQVLVCSVSLSLVTLLSAAAKQPILKPSYDPTIPAVELFEALNQGLIDVSVIPKSAHDANLFVTNKVDRPISVKLPPAIVAVHTLKQGFGQPNPLFGNGPFNASGQQANANGIGQGQGQPIGGGLKGTQTGNFANGNFGNAPAGNFFSIPVEKTIQLPLQTVCLAHGKPDPRPQMKYRLVKLEEFTQNAVLQETLKRFAAGEAERPAAQAAAWHLIDSMSWKELEAKKLDRAGGYPGRPYFDQHQLKAARELIEQATEAAGETKPRLAKSSPKL